MLESRINMVGEHVNMVEEHVSMVGDHVSIGESTITLSSASQLAIAVSNVFGICLSSWRTLL